MDLLSRSWSFLQSRSGQGFALFLGVSALISGAIGYGFYSASLRWLETHKSEEKITALQLVDAFVDNYSAVRAHFSESAPVPATFRATSIQLFNRTNGSDSEFHLLSVGRKGREIATPPADEMMAETIEQLAAQPDPKPRSEFLTVNGQLVFRTVYPTVARQQSCVDCHNKLQPDMHWKLGDVVGAFSIDVPAGAFFASSRRQATGLAFAIFMVLSVVGLAFALLHHRQLAEREAAQRSLKRSEERFRDFAEVASDWFWEQDENLRFTYISHGGPLRIEDALGKTRRETAGEAGDEAQWQAHEAELEARRPFHNFRMQHVLDNGEVRHISVSGKPIFDASGRFRGYRGTGRDVTAEIGVELELACRVEERTAELRRAQHELVGKERLSALGQLTATVAHELRNPLSAIRNTIFSIKESVAASGLKLERPITRVERNIVRCDRIIADLLDFTRLRALNRAPVEADRWLNEVLDEQRVPEGVVLRRNLGARGLQVSLDGERMQRVVVNLLDNAAQAMDSDNGGRERVITVSTRATASHFEFAVEDTGPGIPRDLLNKVFEPLFSTKSFGTGLGLPTVKQIVEQHGGTVEIADRPGGGAHIIVRLPLAVAEEIAA